MCMSANEARGPEYALLELSIHNIRKDLKFTMRVGSKPGTRLDSVLVEDAQLPEAHVIAVGIPNTTTPCQY